jgi:hypothetical protein
MHGSDYDFHYSRYPALAAYIDRIKAEQFNHRRFEIREQVEGTKYPRTVARIKLLPDGTIECKAEEFAPTEAEAAAIKEAMVGVEFPHSVLATPAEVDELEASGLIPDTSKLYVFYTADRKHVIMCQERRDKEDGGKVYLPWTYFAAKGKRSLWKCMEPDDDFLPFWKPRERRNKSSVMIHEGAKAAEYCDALVNDPEKREERKKHPWADELARFEHWGTIGGAFATHRMNYDELRRELKKEESSVVYVCDNDNGGIEAARTFSKMWGRQCSAIVFGKQFKPGFDLADPVPEKLRNKYGRVDVRLLEMARPATWATKLVAPKTGRNAAVYDLTDDFAREWAHTVDPEQYIHRQMPRIVLTEKQFNNFVAPFAHHRVVVSEYLKLRFDGKADTVKYHPGLAVGFHPPANGAGSFFNTYRHPHYEKYKKPPDCSLFENFLEKLFPVPADRHEVKRWLATAIARPEVKIRYSLLLVSETQAVGKSTLAKMLARVIGKWNACTPSPDEILDSNWTYWAEHRLVIIDEIYAGHSAAPYNKLKSVITEDDVRIKKKHLGNYTTENFILIIASSNSMRALKLDNSDRRWLVPKVTEEKQPKKYWTEFYDWLEHDEGDRKIWYWAGEFLKNNEPVATGADAPWTSTKTTMIVDQYSVGMQLLDKMFSWIARAYAAKGEVDDAPVIINGKNGQVEPEQMNRIITLAKKGEHFVMIDKDGRKAIKQQIYDSPDGRSNPEKLESLLTVRKVAKNAGFYTGEERIMFTTWGDAYSGRVISLSKELAAKPVATLIKEKVQVVCLAELAKELEWL